MNEQVIKILIVILPILSFLILIVFLVRSEIEKSKLFLNASEKLILRKEIENELISKNKEVLNDHHERLHEMKRLAEFGRICKGLFHDLMSPLTIISLNIQNIKNHDKHDFKQYEHSIKSVLQAGERMSVYIDNIRTSLRYEDTNKMCSFIEEIEKVITLLSYRIKENNISLNKKLGSDYVWFGNSLLIQHIFTNLFSNAIDSLEISKSSKKEMCIESYKRDKTFYIKIYDNGIGIKNENIEKIFEPFYTTKDKDKGVGIGLTIVKSIIEEKMLGKIYAKNNAKSGVCFTIELPL